jgi:hypothetical protein
MQATATVELDSEGWEIYRNETQGYSFHHPADCELLENDPASDGLSLVGPLADDNNWPQIWISHPLQREDYHPTEGSDLLQWLSEHNMVEEGRQTDVQIAGTTAIHFRFERSQQSYAYDRYYFVHDGQLYMIVIGHAGDKEDWQVYNRFLASFQFEP